MIKTDAEMFEELRVAQKFDVACPPYEAVEILSIYVENYIHSGYFVCLDFAQQVVYHLANDLSLQLVIALLSQSHHILLNPRRLVLHVLILR